ncbi:restriction endonuclease [soil metagenome]
MDTVYHYPPELLNLLTDTIPLLCRSKRDVISFFKGAGITTGITNDLVRKINRDKESIHKYEIVRTVLERLNDRGDQCLRERREILKRVTEFENFSSCWPSDQLKAKGLVSEIRSLVKVKDSFTRMEREKDFERKKRIEERNLKNDDIESHRQIKSRIKADLFSLFAEQNAQKRGKALEGVLNRLFESSGILIKEAFTLKGINGEGTVEQIDGVVEINGDLYLVEMKWWSDDLGPGDVAQHLVRVFSRGHARGIFISNSGYTPAAINTCREALQQSVVALCKLEEIVMLLERELELKDLLKEKITAAIIHKNPFFEPLRSI